MANGYIALSCDHFCLELIQGDLCKDLKVMNFYRFCTPFCLISWASRVGDGASSCDLFVTLVEAWVDFNMSGTLYDVLVHLPDAELIPSCLILLFEPVDKADKRALRINHRLRLTRCL